MTVRRFNLFQLVPFQTYGGRLESSAHNRLAIFYYVRVRARDLDVDDDVRGDGRACVV